MMYMHYCKPCYRVHMLNGHKLECPKCGSSIAELRIPYMEYVSLDMEEREAFKSRCADENQLRNSAPLTVCTSTVNGTRNYIVNSAE